MKRLSVKEMLKEMEKYGVTEEMIRKEYEYEKNESDQAEYYRGKNRITFEDYIKYYYEDTSYIDKYYDNVIKSYDYDEE